VSLNPSLSDTCPPPPSPRTKWTRPVPHPVLIGHAASLQSRSVNGARACFCSAARTHRPGLRARTRGPAPRRAPRRAGGAPREVVLERIEPCRGDHPSLRLLPSQSGWGACKGPPRYGAAGPARRGTHLAHAPSAPCPYASPYGSAALALGTVGGDTWRMPPPNILRQRRACPRPPASARAGATALRGSVCALHARRGSHERKAVVLVKTLVKTLVKGGRTCLMNAAEPTSTDLRAPRTAARPRPRVRPAQPRRTYPSPFTPGAQLRASRSTAPLRPKRVGWGRTRQGRRGPWKGRSRPSRTRGRARRPTPQ
jgi:hypothetical protein